MLRSFSRSALVGWCLLEAQRVYRAFLGLAFRFSFMVCFPHSQIIPEVGDPPQHTIRHLTWKGHEFLDENRNLLA